MRMPRTSSQISRPDAGSQVGPSPSVASARTATSYAVIPRSGENISFEPVDDNSARVTLTDDGRSVSGTMYFDEEGRFKDFVAKRYRTVEGGYNFETWSTPAYEYGELAGLRLPVRGGAVWKLAEGDLKYADITITHLEYDIAR